MLNPFLKIEPMSQYMYNGIKVIVTSVSWKMDNEIYPNVVFYYYTGANVPYSLMQVSWLDFILNASKIKENYNSKQ